MSEAWTNVYDSISLIALWIIFIIHQRQNAKMHEAHADMIHHVFDYIIAHQKQVLGVTDENLNDKLQAARRLYYRTRGLREVKSPDKEQD